MNDSSTTKEMYCIAYSSLYCVILLIYLKLIFLDWLIQLFIIFFICSRYFFQHVKDDVTSYGEFSLMLQLKLLNMHGGIIPSINSCALLKLILIDVKKYIFYDSNVRNLTKLLPHMYANKPISCVVVFTLLPPSWPNQLKWLSCRCMKNYLSFGKFSSTLKLGQSFSLVFRFSSFYRDGRTSS